MPTPKNKTELRSFIGMCSYYRKFINNFAYKLSSLHQLTHDSSLFIWETHHQQAFDEIKSLLTSAPILSHPDFNYPFIVQTDACDIGIGGILCQRINNLERAICYISRTLQPAERKWSIREKEALAIIWSIEQFRPFVVGSSFIVES